jgi:hypothetical protein
MLNDYWGRNGIHLHSEYLGASVLVLAAAAFGADARRSFRRFWLGVGIVTLLWALGGSTPFYHLVYALVPGSKFFRAPSTIFYVVSFAVAVLAALGTERVLAQGASRRFLIGWLIAGGVITLLASSGMLTALAKSISYGFAGDQLEAVIDGNGAALVLGSWRSFLFLGATIGLLWAASTGRLDARRLAWGLVAVVALDLWSVDRKYWMFSPRASVLYGSDPAIEYLKKAEPGRVLALPLTREGLAEHDPNYMGDGLMVHRIRLVKGSHGNEIGRYRRLASREESGD